MVDDGNLARYLCFWIFNRLYWGGSLINLFLKVYFDVFRQCSRFNFRPTKQGSFYIIEVFVDSRR